MLHDNLTVLPILIPLTGAMITLMLRQTQRLQAGCALGSMILSLAASAWLMAAVWQGEAADRVPVRRLVPTLWYHPGR